MRLGDFSAHVVVDRTELKEYEVTVNSSGTQATCWIASEAGKKFSVVWKRHSTAPKDLDSQGILNLDGKRCDNFIFFKDSCLDSITFSVISLGEKERELMFCNLQLTDDEALVGKPASSHLGEITLRVVGGSVDQEGGESRESRESEESEDEDTPVTDLALTSDANNYHEKTVKNLTTHCVGFGPEREDSGDYERVNFVRNRDPPLKFVFKYRPIGILQANSIAPRPTPVLAVPTTLSDDPSAGAQTDTQSVVLERIALLENELKRLRSQVLGEVEDQKPKRIKREHIEKHPVVHGEVIDLT